MPNRITDLRAIGIENGISRLHPYREGIPVPLAPGHAAEVVREGGGGRVFVSVLQPQARENGWSPHDEAEFRALIEKTLEQDFRGHGRISIEYSG